MIVEHDAQAWCPTYCQKDHPSRTTGCVRVDKIRKEKRPTLMEVAFFIEMDVVI